MKGIKSHSHNEREKIVQKLIHADTNRLRELIEKVFSSFEKILDGKRVFPYGVDIKELVT